MNCDENKLLSSQEGAHSAMPSEAQNEVMTARRRLLRVGVKAAPVVVATLASRPALACHCVVPSAWGSINAGFAGVDQDMGKVKLSGSLDRQHGAKIRSWGTHYSIPNWRNQNHTCWNNLIGKLGNIYPGNLLAGLTTNSQKAARKRAYLQGRYSSSATPTRPEIPAMTVNLLCNKIGAPPPVGYGSYKPYEVIDAGGFAGSILVAELNIYLGLYHPDCVKIKDDPNIVFTMAINAYYQPVGLKETWGAQEIEDYLHYNWLARRI